MRIISFETNIFAGLKNTSLSFEDGLNVILGVNESGKSTLVNAIQATFFKRAKVGKRKKADKKFRRNFWPHFGGDYIDGKIKFESRGDSYTLYKRWGNEHKVELEFDDGAKVSKAENVKENLADIFEFGEKAYRSLVFTKQENLNQTIEEIINDNQATNQLGELIRKAVMELDGVSPDRLRDKIVEKKKGLLGKWDMGNNRPKNNRGIHNKYKVGTGEVIESFYKMEELKEEKEVAKRVEAEFEEISNKLKDLEEEKEELREEINELAKLESDILKRGQIEPELEKISAEIEQIKDVSKKWPAKKERLKNKKDELNKLEEKIAAKEEKLVVIAKLKEKKELEADLDKIDKLKENIKNLEAELEELPQLTEKDVEELEDLKNKISKSKAVIESATLVASLNKSDFEVSITTAFDKVKKLEVGEEFKADAYLKIEVADSLELEIKAGEVDFTEQKKELEEAKVEQEELLKKLGVKDLDEAKEIAKELQIKTTNLENEESNLEELIAERDYQKLKSQLDKLEEEIGDSKLHPNQQESIEAELKQLKDEDKLELRDEISRLESKLEDWEEKYESSDKVLDKILDLRTEKRAKEKVLDKLAPLPKEFEKADDFQQHLANLREEKDEIEEKISSKREDYYNKKDELADSSYEELESSYQDAKKEYQKQRKKAEAILKVEEVFKEVEQEISQEPFESLKESFSDYLQILTNHNYQAGVIDKNFNIKVNVEEDKGLPLELLSAGTYAGVALAFRFAFLEYLYENKSGFVVLDDCLVDLDPDRRKAATEIIRDFARENQVIFTTCDPKIAQLLEGNLIEIKSCKNL